MNTHSNYDLLEVIGRGSTATVYRAYDNSLNRYVAIKELNEKFRRDPRRLGEFWEEAQFLAGIRHPNIVQIFNLEREQGWIIMELMSNSLDSVIDKKGLAPDLVRSVLQQSLEALAYLHERGKLHAGVRPASLLIDEQGHIKLSDSAGISVGGEFRKPTGSSKYLSPELINPQFGEVGPGVDLYNLGFAAMELLLGRPSFEAQFQGVGPDAIDPDIGWMRWHGSEQEQFPDLRNWIPGLPEDLAVVLDKLTRKPVAQRYASAAEALRDLENRDLILVRKEDRDRKAAAEAGSPKPPGLAVVPIGAVPPQASFPEPAAPAYRSEGPKPFSGAWFNYQLKRPLVLIVLLLLLLLGTAYFLFFADKEAEDARVSVTVKIKPGDATWKIFRAKKGDWTKALASGDSVLLDPGKWKIKLEHKKLPGREEIIVFDKEKTFEFELRSVILRSDPPGVEIYIGDIKVGKTGEEISGPEFPYTIKLVSKEGTLEKIIASAEDEKELLRLGKKDLLAKTRPLLIKTTPPGAAVVINGKEVGKTDAAFALPDGPFKLELIGPKGFAGIQPFKAETFNPAPGEKEFHHLFLRKLHLSSIPTKATVWVNDKKQKMETDAIYEVPVAPFVLKLEIPGEKYTKALAPGDFDVKSEGGELIAALKVNIPRTSVTFTLNTTPPGADISIEREKGDIIKATSTAKVALPPGEYKMEIAKKGYRTRKDILLKVEKEGDEFTYPLALSGSQALLVGVHDYALKAPAFLHAEPDVETLGEFLRLARFDKVTILTQSRGKDEEPTAENIRARFKSFAADLGAEDVLWVGLFGRVISLDDGDYFWPAGGDPDKSDTLVPLAAILKDLRDCPAQTKVLLIDGWRHTFREVDGPRVAARGFRPAPADVQGILLLGSCQPGQKGYDERLERFGIFGRALTRALTGAADANMDGGITAAELAGFLQKEVLARAKENYGAEQHVTQDSHGISAETLVVFAVPEALKHFGEGMAALERQEWSMARGHFGKALEADKDFVEAYVRRGEASLEEKRFVEAIGDLNEAVKRNKNHGLAWSHLGDAQSEVKLEGLKKANESHQQAIDLEPSFAMGYRDLGRIYLQAGKSEEGLPHFLKATELNPELHLGWYDLGRAQFDLDRFEPALESFNKYMKLCPKDERHLEAGLSLRGEIYRALAKKGGEEVRQKYYDLAREDYFQLVGMKMNAKRADYWNNLGAMDQARGKPKEAVKAFEKATALDGKYFDAFYNLGVTRKILGDYTRAIDALKRAVVLNAKSYDAHRNLADAYRLRAKGPDRRPEDAAEALRHENKAKELKSSFK